MKKLALILLVIISTFDCINAQVPSNCTVPQLLATDYERDIKNLALRRMYQLQSPDTAIIRIPQSWQDTIAEGLSAIFNATSIPERDTIFNLYCVHDNTGGYIESLHSLLIHVDTSYAWTQAWQNLNPITGNSYIDSLVIKYDLSVSQFFNWTIGNYALIHTDSLWNIHALIDSFEQELGVISGDPNGIIGAAGKIVYNKIGSSKYYDFYFEFDDCFDGCDNYRMWKFKVNSDCSVDYLGYTEWGVFGISPLPPPISCNTFVSVAEDYIQKGSYIIFPNPANDLITIKASNNTLGSTYIIIDQTGRQVLTGKLNNETTSVDISQLATGVYLFQVGQQRKQTFKVIKK